MSIDPQPHPDTVTALVRIGWLESPDQARVARAARLRRDLGLNWSGALLACDLLARIDLLEQRLRRYERPR
ncbi:MAG: chaperone modulatory protein CbpM [Solirubrobacteraceae bacterium]|jgi:hypothetical protein|nr:chaperone modulatory protein CbpM [Solirubrobacteraceae bacterium]